MGQALAGRPRPRTDRACAGGSDGRGPNAAAGRPYPRQPEGGRGVTTFVDREVLDPEIAADIDKFDRLLAQYEAGELEEDQWRVFRLANGIYGQRQGGTNQMVRVKIPYGSLNPEQLEMMGHIADTYSRGWGP